MMSATDIVGLYFVYHCQTASDFPVSFRYFCFLVQIAALQAYVEHGDDYDAKKTSDKTIKGW